MFGGRSRNQYGVAAAIASAPPSTKDALAIIRQDLETVTHSPRNV